MERLTRVYEEDNQKYVCIDVCGEKCIENNEWCPNCKPFTDVMKKLAHYEDLEEQGKLIELPCKVGDTVWCLEEDEYAGYVFLATSGEYYIVSAHYTHCDNINEQLEEMEEDTENWGEANVSVFHKDKVFLTKEGARAKLKEMEGES